MTDLFIKNKSNEINANMSETVSINNVIAKIQNKSSANHVNVNHVNANVNANHVNTNHVNTNHVNVNAN
jgi:hypothetical protein